LARRWATLPFLALAPPLEATSSTASSRLIELRVGLLLRHNDGISSPREACVDLRWDQGELYQPKKWVEQACIKRRCFVRRLSFVFLRPPYRALLDAFVCILGTLRRKSLMFDLVGGVLLFGLQGSIGDQTDIGTASQTWTSMENISRAPEQVLFLQRLSRG